MLTIISNEQAESLITNDILLVNDDIEIAFDGFKIQADIKCRNIYSQDYPRNIDAHNINAGSIDARNIRVFDIKAWDIDAHNIHAEDIKAFDIRARNIIAVDIKAINIDALNIDYYAICWAYQNITCTSIKGRLKKAKHFCEFREIIIKQKENENVNNNLK